MSEGVTGLLSAAQYASLRATSDKTGRSLALDQSHCGRGECEPDGCDV